jgi:hypothetical protein
LLVRNLSTKVIREGVTVVQPRDSRVRQEIEKSWTQ